MRTTWKRTVVAVLIAGAVGGAALGLGRPGDPPPTFIPHTEESKPLPEPAAVPAVIQAQAVEPVAKSDTGVALEWSGPAVVKVHQPTEYTLNVRNVCGQALQKVVVQVRAPKGTEIVSVAPAVKPIDGVYLWELGTLDAKASQAVTVTLKQPAKGEMACQAWVTLTGTSAMKAAVKEPKLAVTIVAPEKVVLGDLFPIHYEVVNSGEVAVTNVEVFVTDGVDSACSYVDLKPGKRAKLGANPQAKVAGPITFEVVASGHDDLKATAKATVQVLVPKLDVKVTGPAERLIGTKGKYAVTVTNSGDTAVCGVTVSETYPAGFKVSATGPGKLSENKLSWTVGDLAPGASKVVEFEGYSNSPGAVTHKVEATGDRNTKATGECVTKVEGIPGLRMELVDNADPVEKGGEVTYEIKVTNTGTKADSEVKIVCELPKELEYVSCSGPTKGARVPRTAELPEVTPGFKPGYLKSPVVGQDVHFDPISDLAPKTEAVYKVKVKGVGTGDVRFKAVMTSKHLTAPVTKEESTRVYGE